MNPAQKFPPYFHKIHSNIILSSTRRFSEWSLPSGFRTKVGTHFASLLCVLHALHIILLDVITMISDEVYKLLSSSFCCLLYLPDTFSHLRLNTRLLGFRIGSKVCDNVIYRELETRTHLRSLTGEMRAPFETVVKLTFLSVLILQYSLFIVCGPHPQLQSHPGIRWESSNVFKYAWLPG